MYRCSAKLRTVATLFFVFDFSKRRHLERHGVVQVSEECCQFHRRLFTGIDAPWLGARTLQPSAALVIWFTQGSTTPNSLALNPQRSYSTYEHGRSRQTATYARPWNCCYTTATTTVATSSPWSSLLSRNKTHPDFILRLLDQTVPPYFTEGGVLQCIFFAVVYTTVHYRLRLSILLRLLRYPRTQMVRAHGWFAFLLPFPDDHRRRFSIVLDASLVCGMALPTVFPFPPRIRNQKQATLGNYRVCAA